MNIHRPCCCTVHAYAVIHFCESMLSFWVEANQCILYINVWSFDIQLPRLVGSGYPMSKIGGFGISNVQDWWVRMIAFHYSIQPRHILCFVPSKNLDFQRHLSWSLFMVNELRWEVIVHSVDIDGVVDHHCINFL